MSKRKFTSEGMEHRKKIISTPNLLWKIKKSSLEIEEETEICYFFRIFWKFKIKMLHSVKAIDKGKQSEMDRQLIEVDLIIHRASVNYPKINFSLTCGWLAEDSDYTSHLQTSEVSLEDLITKNKKYIEIWQHYLSVFLDPREFPVDTLYFFCSVQLQHDSLKHFTELIEKQPPLHSSYCKSALAEDLRNFVGTPAMTDVILKCGDQSIPAHKYILSSHSPVFQAMFKNDFKESRQGVVDILDVEPPVLKLLIQYVYTGNIDTTQESVESFCNLFRVADKYCMEPLKEKCVDLIKRKLEPRHACDVLLMSQFYGHKDLKTYVVSYIAKRKEFLLSEDWRKFANDHSILAQEAFFLFISKA